MCEMVWFDSESIMRLELFDTPPSPPPKVRSYEFLLVFESVRPSIRLSTTNFCRNMFISFH